MAALVTEHSDGQARKAPGLLVHTWGPWLIVEHLDDDLQLVERVCVTPGCGQDQVVTSDCLGEWSLALTEACRGRAVGA